jgi:hypothetical protein
MSARSRLNSATIASPDQVGVRIDETSITQPGIDPRFT